MIKKQAKSTVAFLLSARLLEVPFLGTPLRAYAAKGKSEVISNNENGIPDKELYDIILSSGDGDKDGILTKDEAEKISKMPLDSNNIRDISVLQNLTNLRILSLKDKGISKIEALSSLTNLRTLYLNDNSIIYLMFCNRRIVR